MLNNPKDIQDGSLAATLTLPAPRRTGLTRALSLRPALIVLFSRGRLVTVVTAGILALTLLTIALIPARYHSEARLMVRLGRESVVIDSTARIGQAAVPSEGRDKEINSEIELLKSRKLTEAVVSQLTPGRILGRKAGAAPSTTDAADAIAMVETKMAVKAIPDSNILSIGYDSPDPELSRDVVARLIDAYLDERSRIYRDQGDLKFFQGQLEGARRQQAEAQHMLGELRDVTGVDSPEQQRAILLSRVDTMQRDIDAARADLAAVTSSVDAIGHQLSALHAEQVIRENNGAASDSLDAARARLTEMRLQEVDLCVRYGDDARPLKILRQKIAVTEKRIAAIGVSRTVEELTVRREADLAKQASLQSRIQSLDAARTKAQSGLAWIDQAGMKSQTLEQNFAHAAANVARYAEAYEQARIDQQMGQQRIGNISVAEPPVLPLRPKARGRSLLAMAGLLLAISLGLGSAFVANALDHTIHRVEHLHGLGLRHTISIPCVTDYEDSYRRGLSPARRATITIAPAPLLDDAPTECAPLLPLRGLIRNSADPSVSGPRAPAGASICDLDLTDDDSVIIDVDESELIYLRQAQNAHAPAGPLAISPSILAAIRGAIDHLIPLDDQQGAARVIGVVGARDGEGASSIAVHLAIALTHRIDSGLNLPSPTNRVLLLDCDIESPTASLLAGAPSARGLGDWVDMRTPDTNSLTDMIVPTRQDLLDVLPTGAPRERSSLAPRMPLVVDAMRQRYRHTVIDLPSLTTSDASASIAALCDTVVFGCQANELRIEAAQQALRRLRDAGANVSLAILNKRRYPVPQWAYRLS